MNKIIIPVLASVLILGVLGTAEDAFAPKKLFVGGLSWDAESQSFEITLEMNRGMFEAIQHADFTLDTKINWSGGGVSFEKKESTSGDRDNDEIGRIKVQFPWDRSLPDGSSFEGLTDVTVNSQIQNPAGKPVAIAAPTTFENVFIAPPEPEPTCEETCGEVAESVYDDCIAAGGDGEVCTEAFIVAFYACIVECTASDVCEFDASGTGNLPEECPDPPIRIELP